MVGRVLAVAALLVFAKAAAAQPDVVRVDPQVQEWYRVYAPRPVYPELAKTARIEGMVRLAVLIGRDGAVERIRLISGHPLLVKAAMDAVKQWRYTPSYRFGRPMQVMTTVDVHFTLNGRGATEANRRAVRV